jgi:diguanylate cyclase (GGDEF)-like protein
VWSLPRPAIVYLLLVLTGGVVGAGLVSTRWPHTSAPYAAAGALAIAMFAHQQLSRVIERIRRDQPRAPRVNAMSVWSLPGALVLPPTLAVALVVVVHLSRFVLIGRHEHGRPPHRHLVNAATMVITALATTSVVAASGRREHVTNNPGGWADLVVLLAAAATYWLVNSVIVAGIIALTVTVRHPRELTPSADDNLLEAGAMLLGIFVALAVLWWPPFAVLMVLPALVLHRTILIHQLEEAARSDEKTGVLNAVAWTHQARADLVQMRRQARSVAVLMIDLDGFKQVNDVHGHLVGDTVLQRVAQVLTEEVRHTDAVGRFGGDEFAVLLPDIDTTEAAGIAERIRQRVRELPAPAGTGLSASIGVAVYPRVAEETLEGMLAAADIALYTAKDNGRDQIRLADRPPSSRWLPSAHGVATTYVAQPAPEVSPPSSPA